MHVQPNRIDPATTRSAAAADARLTWIIAALVGVIGGLLISFASQRAARAAKSQEPEIASPYVVSTPLSDPPIAEAVFPNTYEAPAEAARPPEPPREPHPPKPLRAWTEAELSSQLRRMPEVNSRSPKTGLPLLTGNETKIPPDEARVMTAFGMVHRALGPITDVSRKHGFAQMIWSGNVIGDSVGSRGLSVGPSDLVEPVAVRGLQQVLQTEDDKGRSRLIRFLDQIEGPVASQALAQRALFELAPALRQQAVTALSKRPRAEYRQVLLDGLRYPWPPAADHAARALVQVSDTNAIEALQHLLDEPDPRLLFQDQQEWYVREIVKVQHLANCFMCHPQSKRPADLRGLVPVPGKAISLSYYLDEDKTDRTALFVRSDVVFLKPDFSVLQPVDDPGPWPTEQRFDYVVRRRPAKEETRHTMDGDYPQRNAVRFALWHLTRKGQR
jgi:hypothetical protein